jgi:hypothetical protein
MKVRSLLAGPPHAVNSFPSLSLDYVLSVVSPPTLADSSVQQSDCDAQLFIHLTFSQVVKVQSLLILCAESVREMAPTKASVCAPSFLPCYIRERNQQKTGRRWWYTFKPSCTSKHF